MMMAFDDRLTASQTSSNLTTQRANSSSYVRYRTSGVPSEPGNYEFYSQRRAHDRTCRQDEGQQGQLHRQGAFRTKRRLPWLDGSESRRPSDPRVPGAFHEESHSPEQKVPNNQLAGIQRPLPETPKSAQPPESMPDTPRTTPQNGLLRANSPQPVPSVSSYHESIAEQRSSQNNLQEDSNAKFQNPLSIPPRRASTVGPTISSISIAPARSMTQNALSSAPRGVSELSFRRATSDIGSERTPVSPGQHDSQAPLEEPPKTRQQSLSIQPLRAHKVRTTPYERNLSNRRISLAVQPIRARTYQSLSEDSAPKDRKASAVAGSSRRPKSFAQPPELSPKDSGANEDQTTKTLRESIAGFENLMQEAMRLAKEAADSDRAGEVPALLEEAKVTLRRASEIQNTQREAVRSQSIPLRRAPSSSEETEWYTHDFSDTSDSSTSASSTGYNRNRKRHTSRKRNTNGTTDHREHEVAGADLIDNKDSKTTRGGIRKCRCCKGKGKQKQYQDNKALDLPSQPDQSHLPQRDHVNHLSRSQPTATQDSAAIPVRRTPSYFSGQGPSGQNRDVGFEGTHSPHIPAEADAPSPLDPPLNPTPAYPFSTPGQNWGRDKFDEKDFINADVLKDKHHLSLKDGERFSLHRNHKRQPIARNWSTLRKRFTAFIACFNTALVGLLIGIYAGEVPAIQYALADQHHHVILGNVVLYVAMGITTLIFWPLPLLHGRKPYTLIAFLVALPLQFPQAIVVGTHRTPGYAGYKVGLLLSRALSGFALGFAHINFKSTLLDLFGSSLQSNKPHGEFVLTDDIRRHGGGMGLWLGIWSWCFIGSLAIGFLVGADIISGLNVSWGFYISVILIAITLFLNVISPETRRAPHRRTVQEVELPNDTTSRRVARGEIRMHVAGDGPKWWWEEVSAGLYLSFRMLLQSGFLVMALYLAWIYAEIVLVIVLLGNLLSKEYSWRPEYVGLGVFSVAVGALLAIPNAKANIFSRSRVQGPRTDSMTFEPRFTWTSHLVRRALFMTALPIAGLAYTLASAGTSVQYMAPIVLAGLIGYISNLAIAECNGIIMETFDTSDLQPGTNSRHRLQSLPQATRRRRTTYSSYPRVSAGFFTSQAMGFFLAAAATGVGGVITRSVGAQKATAITAGILLGLTLLLTCALWRFKDVQVIPNELFGHYFGDPKTKRASTTSIDSDKSWRAVIIGNPSGKVRRMSWLEMGSLSRWTEIRRLNRLLSRRTTQPLNAGWQ